MNNSHNTQIRKSFRHSLTPQNHTPNKSISRSPSPSNFKLLYWANKVSFPSSTLQNTQQTSLSKTYRQSVQNNQNYQELNLTANLSQKQSLMNRKSGERTSLSQTQIKEANKSSQNAMQRINKMIEQAKLKDLKMKKKIYQMKKNRQQTEYKQIYQYKFNPKLIKNTRYQVTNNFHSRIQQSQQNKLTKLLKIKQTDLQTKMKQCTFSPNLSQKSIQIVENKYRKRIQMEVDRRQSINIEPIHAVSQNTIPKKYNKSINFQVAKRFIHYQLNLIQPN